MVVDQRLAAAKLTEHLVGLGHRPIALLADETCWTTGRDRIRGFELALGQAGIAVEEALTVAAGWRVDEASTAALTMLDTSNRPTAVMAANAVLAESVWRAAAELGLQIPADVSLVSMDEAAWMTLVSPGVTAVRQDGVALGEAAVNRLLERITAPTTPITTLAFRVEVTRRGSCGPAAAAQAVRPVA